MTPDQISLVRQTMTWVQPRRQEFAADFYRRLFAADPGLEGMFSTDPVIQQEKFVDELTAIVAAISDFPAFLLRAGALGVRHVNYQVRAEHYRVMREVLAATFAAGFPQDWTAEHEQAWRSAYDMVAEAMLLGRGRSADAPRAAWRP
ncbi:hypothetical protein Cs7R123_62650 [Catellatospora sp. TT07R-123]|uniref:globin domain-containing protein n=1 Tax=Catellatospora sp. TT07R-123 TaxID=2733863 RepID=UPI001B1CEC49|nr:globin domain-containing protein [Catellatospora sp. TT07R-123]GHJ48923.1 hypothetical protein Cs7R123_62650 [Catellatospora sp. TT07R-123]